MSPDTQYRIARVIRAIAMVILALALIGFLSALFEGRFLDMIVPGTFMVLFAFVFRAMNKKTASLINN